MIAQDFVFSGNFPRECRLRAPTFGAPMDPADCGKFPEETKHQQGREHIYEMSGLILRFDIAHAARHQGVFPQRFVENGRIGQHCLDVITGFVEWNRFHP